MVWSYSRLQFAVDFEKHYMKDYIFVAIAMSYSWKVLYNKSVMCQTRNVATCVSCLRKSWITEGWLKECRLCVHGVTRFSCA